MRRTTEYTILMEPPPIANGAEISRIFCGVKIAKIDYKYRRLGKISIFMQGRLK
jgi:hypothetical protein